MSIGSVLRHEYHRLSDQLIWSVVKDRLGPLESAVLTIEANLDEEA